MGDILALDKLVLFILFVMPGFIALKTYSLLIPSEQKPSSEQLIDAIAYSCINYAVLLWPIYSVEAANVRATAPGWYAAFYVFVLLVAPVSMSCAWFYLRKTEFFKAVFHHPTSNAWDYVFGQRKPYWVVVTLKNGKMVGGKYNDKSFASGSPVPEQIYLEEAWEINDGGAFERAYEESAGIIVLSSEIMTAELFNLTTGESDGGQSERQGGGELSGRLSAEEGPVAGEGWLPADKERGQAGESSTEKEVIA